MKYENRLIVFIDILGFSDKVRKSLHDEEEIEQIYTALKYLKNLENPNGWSTEPVAIEESAQYKGVDFFEIQNHTNSTCFSDNILISVKICDELHLDQAVSTLVANLSGIGAYLLSKGILIRGGMTIGKLYHSSDGIVFGQGLVEAYNLESRIAEFPRVILSKKLLECLNYPQTIKSEEYPYCQYLQRFEDGCVGFHQLIYFQVMDNWDGYPNEKKKTDLSLCRRVIINGIDEQFESPKVYKKYTWIKEQYNRLIIFTEDAKKPIMELNKNIAFSDIYYKTTDEFYHKGT